MRPRSIILVALAAANIVSACPSLPEDSGFEWVYKRGPDFEVCYANENGSDRTAFGVYFGEHPAFRAKGSDKLGKSRVAGKEVTWYKNERPESDSPLGRETVIAINMPYGAVAHVWVRAATEAELKQRLAVLEKMTFDD